MFNPVFTNDAIWIEFYKILQSWKGTPYRHLQSVKGRGADCALFLANCFIEGKFIKEVPLTIEYYPRDWHQHSTEEIVLNSFRTFSEKNLFPNYVFTEFSYGEQDLLRGDVVTFKTSKKVTNHTVIMIDSEKFIHCTNRGGVLESSLNAKILFSSTWKEKISKIFRLGYENGI